MSDTCARLLLCAAALCTSASAEHVWLSPTGGGFATGANWSAGSMPGPSDRAVFSLPATYDVWAASPMSSFSMRVSAGDVSLKLSGGGSLDLLNPASSMWQHSLNVGGPGLGATLRVAGGSLRARSAYLASDAAHAALGEVSGAGSLWSCADDLHVGFAGSATLRAIDGGVCSARSIIVGGSFSASAGALVHGHASQLIASSRIVVGSSGQAVLSIEQGAACLSAYADLGAYAGSKGAVVVTGSGSTLDAQHQVSVGGSAFTSKAGVGSLTVEAGASVNTTRLAIAENPEGSGAVLVQGPDTFITAQSVVIGPVDTPHTSPSATMRVASGAMLLASNVSISPYARLDGDGLISASVVSNGIIQPGADVPGTLRIDGDYTQIPGPNYALATSELRVRIGASADAAVAGSLDVTGAASLGGRLRVSFVPGFVPEVGQVFRVLSASSVDGAFQQVILPTPTTAWRLRFLPDALGASIEVISGGIPGDTNGDCIVNFSDLNNILSTYGQTGLGLVGDANGDGVVNFHDLNLALSNYGQTC